MSSLSRKGHVPTHRAINEEVKITKLGWIGNLKYILDSYRLSNLMRNIFTVIEGDISKNDYKKT